MRASQGVLGIEFGFKQVLQIRVGGNTSPVPVAELDEPLLLNHTASMFFVQAFVELFHNI